ncbi:MAG: TlpA disulfide reductase family protein [Campylobacterota bacterium]|nr:TlpA disulfide reductase family protein [Campylobacterota bacterium]
MKQTALLSSFLVLTLFFNGCGNDAKQAQEPVTAIEKKVINENEYHLTAIDNSKYIIKKQNNGFILQNAEDKIIILDIFATWCPPCRAAVSHLSSLKEKYKDDLIIIALTIETPISNEKLNDFKTKNNANYTFVNSPENKRLIDAVASSLDVGKRFPIPLMAMYKDGKLINHYVGMVEEEFIESDIKRALEK